MAPTVDSVLDRVDTVVTVGPRPFSARRLMSMTAAAVLMSGVMFAATPEAKAQNWSSLLKNDSTSAREYGRNEALRSANGRLAEVVQVRQVDIKNTNSVNFGSVVGGALGVAATKDIKNSNARNLARVALGGLGAAAGSKVQQRATRRDGVEVTVMEVDNRNRTSLKTIVQDNDQMIRPGDIVMLSGSGSKLRAIPLNPETQARLRGQQVNQEVQFNSIEQRRSSQQGYQESYRPTHPRFGR